MSTLLLKAVAASAVLALVCWSSQHWLLDGWTRLAFAPRLGLLMLTITAGIAAFLGCGVALRIEELQELMDALRRRVHRKP